MKLKLCTPKQLGDACEMLIAAELTLAGTPAIKMPDNWPYYDVIAQPKDGGPPQRISVKARTFTPGPAFVNYSATDQFDWLAIVLLPSEHQANRKFFIVPKEVADALGVRPKAQMKNIDDMYWQHDKVAQKFSPYENNFSLSKTGSASL